MDELSMQWLILFILIPYLYLLIRIYRGLTELKPFNPGKPGNTFVSVIVACRDEELNLPLLLSDLARQSIDPDQFEVIIIDDNSTDSTFTVASGNSDIRNLKVISNNGRGKKKAVMTGVEVSEGELIITTDSDCRIGSEWLSTIISYFELTKAEFIICPVVLKGGKGFFRRFQELEFLSLQGVTAGTASLRNPVMCNGAGLAFTKDIYLKHAADLHFELQSGDDMFLLQSIKRKDRGITGWIESESAEVTTASSPSLGSFIRQRSRWISKTGSYSDLSAILLAIVTFVTILVQLALLVAGILMPEKLLIFGCFFILKSIPDFLILLNTTKRRHKTNLLKWFFPSQFVYPIYLLMIVLCSPFLRNSWRF